MQYHVRQQITKESAKVLIMRAFKSRVSSYNKYTDVMARQLLPWLLKLAVLQQPVAGLMIQSLK